VQMPDLDGFGVIENVEPSTGPAPVYIFVTAHDAHAIRAFEVHAIDYLLKPYDKERFAKALVHARQVLEHRREANRGLEPLLQSLRSLRPLERFVVKEKKRIFFVPVSNVLWIEATGNYACIHTARSGISTPLLRRLTYRTSLTFDCCSGLRLMQQILSSGVRRATSECSSRRSLERPHVDLSV
ncbi:MAG: response regulator, partial [Candidatus Sulfotelmatobacter sp.]